MKKNIIIALILISAFISTSNAQIINPDYSDGYNMINYTITDTTYINIPAGNVIDSIIFKPVFLAGIPGEYNITCSYYCNDELYIDEYKSTISTSLFHLLSNKYTYDIRHTVNSELNYHKEYETYVSKICWFPIKISSFFGSHSNALDTQVSVETEIFGHTGIKRSTDVFNVHGSTAFSSQNYTITHDGFTDLDIIVVYKLIGVHTTEYYIGQLNPTMKFMYKLGFSWMDKELYILNMFIISDKLITIIMFWLNILAKSFIPLTFICVVFVVPFCAYYNSHGRKMFINNLVIYYSSFFNVILSFVRYSIHIIMRSAELVRGLIPWI